MIIDQSDVVVALGERCCEKLGVLAAIVLRDAGSKACMSLFKVFTLLKVERAKVKVGLDVVLVDLKGAIIETLKLGEQGVRQRVA